MLDVIIILEFPVSSIANVYQEFDSGVSDGEFVKRFRLDRIEWAGQEAIPLNLDGEGIDSNKVQIEVLPCAIQMILPDKCPCLVRELKGETDVIG